VDGGAVGGDGAHPAPGVGPPSWPGAHDLIVSIADGGDCLADLSVVREQPDLFGEVASSPTGWRVIDAITPSGWGSARRPPARARAGLAHRGAQEACAQPEALAWRERDPAPRPPTVRGGIQAVPHLERAVVPVEDLDAELLVDGGRDLELVPAPTGVRGPVDERGTEGRRHEPGPCHGA